MTTRWVTKRTTPYWCRPRCCFGMPVTFATTTVPGVRQHDTLIKSRFLESVGKSQAAVEACCHGLQPGGGSSRRTINPIIAHLIMASLVCGSRS